MSTHPPAIAASLLRPQARSYLYRRIWRWHFYAGVLCLPLLLSLALTGALYVFHREIDDVVYRDLLLRQQVVAGPAANAERLVAAALARAPGRALALTWPSDDRHTVQVDVLQEHGARQVFLDPVSAAVQGSIASDDRLMSQVKRIHSLAVAGPLGQGLVEIAAGWLIVLALSGVFLWWPRGHRGTWAIRRGAHGRTWWRDLHAVTGAYAAVLLVFLALTGMPWSVFWGHHVNGWLSAHGLGVPDGVWRKLPRSTVPVATLGEVPWTLERQPLPRSVPRAGGARAVGADVAAARLRAMGMHAGVRLTLPQGADGVYTGMRAHGVALRQRTVHLDQYSGKVLMDIRAEDYGAAGRVIEWGVAVHQGDEYGRINQWAMFAACMALVALCASGVLTWWKRRPQGRLGAPRRNPGEPLPRAMLAMAALLGVLFPLVGASMLAVAALDWCLPERWKQGGGM